MPRPAARPNRSQTQRGNPAVAQPIRDDSGEFEFDGMDILVGVVLLIVIPGVVYVGLSLVGMPVSGGGSGDAISALERQEQIAQNRASVPLSKREFEEQFTWVRGLLSRRVPDFIERAKTEAEPPIKNNWVLYALSVCGRCEAVLDKLQKGIDGNKNFQSDPTYAQGIHGQKQLIANLRRDIDEQDIFKAARPN